MTASLTPVEVLRPYMCWAGEDPEDGAVLAFARTSKDARKLAYPYVADWTGCDFIDVRAKWLKEYAGYLLTLKIKDVPHVIDNPPVCKVCETWGYPPNQNGNGCIGCGGD